MPSPGEAVAFPAAPAPPPPSAPFKSAAFSRDTAYSRSAAADADIYASAYNIASILTEPEVISRRHLVTWLSPVGQRARIVPFGSVVCGGERKRWQLSVSSHPKERPEGRATYISSHATK